jgi:N-acetyl-gamma-glutamyl-phosphate reductase
MNNYALTMHNYSVSKMDVAVVGGSGYSGLELVRLLKKHPAVETVAVFNSSTVSTLEAQNYAVVFLATPAEVSSELAPKIILAGTKVIDLSGAFRLQDEASFKEWYKFDHPSFGLSKNAHYGLVPWMKPAAETMLVANPGCYATAILMALLPLVKMDVIKLESLVIDAKSGTTGAGKKASESLLFSEVEGECLPYKVGVHQHLPEINLQVKTLSGKKMNPFFSTSLLATRRGIVAGLYATLKEGKTLLHVEEAFQEFYANYPLVKMKSQASLKQVVGTAETHLSFHVVGEKLYLFSCLDNLLKGAASQGIENFNLIHGLPSNMGMDHLEAVL